MFGQISPVDSVVACVLRMGSIRKSKSYSNDSQLRFCFLPHLHIYTHTHTRILTLRPPFLALVIGVRVAAIMQISSRPSV